MVAGSTDNIESPLASVVISTYNRGDALQETLHALLRQDLPANRYEIIVVDDGSTDRTPRVLETLGTSASLRTIRHEGNRGVSAGRNSGIRAARGDYVILLSDDVLVPENFISQHVETLERFPGAWIGGAFHQLNQLTDTPFGRYVEDLERQYDDARKARPVGPGLWETLWPTARNLSLPRADLDRVGLFDERFQTSCEDQDLAERARRAGVRFILNASIECIHNDQLADLDRFCRFQERGTGDTVLLCAKYPELHGGSALAKVNGRVTRGDGVALSAKKLAKLVISYQPIDKSLRRLIRHAEEAHLPEPLLRKAYKVAVGAATFRGWRRGLRRWGKLSSPADSEWPAVSVTLVLYRCEERVADTIASIEPDLASGFAELIAVDNASPDHAAAVVSREAPKAKLIESAVNGGFSAGANLAWPHSRGRYWLLLNPDVVLSGEGVRELAHWMDMHPEVAATSPALADGDGSNVRPSGRSLPSVSRVLLTLSRLHRLLPHGLRARWLQGAYWDAGDQFNAGWVPGAAVMVRREAIEEVGLLDESFFLYGEDLEWCWRMRRAGWRIGACNSVIARHHESESALREFGADSRVLRITQSEFDVIRRVRGRTAAVAYAGISAFAMAVESRHPRRSTDQRAAAQARCAAWRRVLATATG